MRSTFPMLRSALSVVAGGLLLAACGGGSSGGGGGGGLAATAQLHGHLVSRNGSTSNLGGIQFTLIGTGQTVVTGPDGSFNFGAVPAGTIGLRVKDPASPLTAPLALTAVAPQGDGTGDGTGDAQGDGTASGDDASEANDATDADPNDDGDANDVGDDDFDLSGVGDGEDVEVKVSIVNGVVVSLDTSHTGHTEIEAELRLTRSVDSDDPDVEGSAKAESGDQGDRVKVEAENLDPFRSVELFVIDKGGVSESEGTRAATDGGRAEWVADTQHGDALPFGVASVADLLGFGIEVRDATSGLLLLFGTIPDELPNHADDGHEDHHRHEGRVHLTNAVGVVGEAHVEIKSRPEESREEFAADAEHVTPGLLINVLLEDPANLGTFTVVGTITIGAEGAGEMQIDTHEGDTLPYGATSVSAFVGLHVEMRDAGTNSLLFSGVVPALVAD